MLDDQYPIIILRAADNCKSRGYFLINNILFTLLYNLFYICQLTVLCIRLTTLCIVNITDASYPYITHVSRRPCKATLKHLYTHSILYTINNIQSLNLPRPKQYKRVIIELTPEIVTSPSGQEIIQLG